MPRLPLEPDELLHVLVPSRAIARTVEAVSPRIRAYRIDAEDGRRPVTRPRAGLGAAQQRRPLPPASSRRLPRLRLVQLLSAGAERFVGRLPEGVLLCNARGAHTPSTAEWAVAATLAAQRGIPFFVREQAAGRWSSTTFSSLVGARVLVVGAGDIGRTIGRMLAGFDVELTYVARTARDGVRSTAELPELLPHADVVDPHRPRDAGDDRDGRRRVPGRDAGRRPVGERGAGVVVDTDALLAELTRDGCARRWTSPTPSRCRRGTRSGRRPGCCSPRTSGVRFRTPTSAPPRRSPTSWPASSPASHWSTSSTATDPAAARDLDPPAGELREAGQVAGPHHRHVAPRYRASSPATGRRPAPPGFPASSFHGTRRCPARVRTVSPSSPMSTPARSTQTATASGTQQQHRRPRRGEGQRDRAQRQQPDGDQRGPGHAQAGGRSPRGGHAPTRAGRPGDRGLASPVVTTVEDPAPAPRPTAR